MALGSVVSWELGTDHWELTPMKIALGSDERAAVTDAVEAALCDRGHEVVTILPAAGETLPWPEVGAWVGGQVASGAVATGVLFCWTGTGVSMAANKVAGVRAALCGDAETARGARRWNDANVLVMSLRATTPTVAVEILDAWFDATPSDDPADQAAIRALAALEER